MKPRKNYRTRPKKVGAKKRQRVLAQKKKLKAAGYDEDKLHSMNTVQIREALKKTAKKPSKKPSGAGKKAAVKKTVKKTVPAKKAVKKSVEKKASPAKTKKKTPAAPKKK